MPLAEGVTLREEGLAPKLSGSYPSKQKWEGKREMGLEGMWGGPLLHASGVRTSGSGFWLQIVKRKS